MIVLHRQTAAELKIDMVNEPHGNLRLLRRRMVVVIYEITNEVADGCTRQGVGRVMPPTSEASDTHCRCGGVRHPRNPLVVGVLTSSNSGERPGLDRVARRERVASLKKLYRIAFVFGTRPLRCELEYIDRDIRINQSFDPDSSRIAGPRMIADFSVHIEHCPQRIDGRVGAYT